MSELEPEDREFRDCCGEASKYLGAIVYTKVIHNWEDKAAKKDIHEVNIDKAFIGMGKVFLSHWGLNTDLDILIKQIIRELAEEIL